ncbi:hypothetical protein [Spartinivicinus marinus]|uniref:hypothetical protein n=1 Tax=Spartinivicinus marinus TaxID=2994442 RepID=UPI0021044CDB|nr:hypothetical protein [Spartinivicinus marinus]MCX4027413.1 hypothetical protein [Spartinivicinus marinus]
MSNFNPINKLEVFRRLSSNERVAVGTLAQNAQAVFFQYHSDYLQHYDNLSPFNLQFDNSLQQAPKSPHMGLHMAINPPTEQFWCNSLVSVEAL